MLLAINIGNSTISAGVFSKSSASLSQTPIVRCLFSVANRPASEDEFLLLFRDLLALRGYRCAGLVSDNSGDFNTESVIDCAVVASVVPNQTDNLMRAAERLCGKTPFLISSGIRTGFGIRLRNPEQLGADLVSNIAGSLRLTNVPLVILDMNTATTLTAVDRNRDMIGTVICPGLRISLDALSASAAQLSDVFLESGNELLGRDTKSAICSGVLNGHAYMIDGFLRGIREQLGLRETGEKLELIATGSLARYVLPCLRNKFTFDESLTLKGEAILFYKNVKD